MAITIPFTQETFRPLCIKGNDHTTTPVEFDISAIGGANRARLKSIMVASEGLELASNWTPQVQANVIAAFESGAPVFVDGVDAVRGLFVPAALALKVGLIHELPAPGEDNRRPDVAITTGRAFSLVSGYWPVLAFEVALAIARASGQAEIDPRFFRWLSTSAGLPATPSGTVERAARARKGRETAGSRTSAVSAGGIT